MTKDPSGSIEPGLRFLVRRRVLVRFSGQSPRSLAKVLGKGNAITSVTHSGPRRVGRAIRTARWAGEIGV